MVRRSEGFALAVRFGLALGATLVTGRFLHGELKHPWIGTDDANIFMVYARNLVEGHGFVFHAGGERVEGFSSFLYPLLIAPFFELTSVPEVGMLLLSALFTAGAVALAMLTTARLAGTAPGRLAPAEIVVLAWCFLSPEFVVWTTLSLMETALWCAVWTGTAALAVVESLAAEHSAARFRIALVLAPLLYLVRPEGAVLALALIGAFALAARRRHATPGEALRAWAPLPLAWAAGVTALTAFRLGYFGHPLPNTYYAKVSPDPITNLARGADYLWSFLGFHPLVPPLLACALLGFVLVLPLAWGVMVRGPRGGTPDAAADRRRLAGFCVCGLVLLGLVLPLPGGGEHFGGFRFYQSWWPLLTAPVLFVLGEFLQRRPRRPLPAGAAWGAAAMLVAVLWLISPVRWPEFEWQSSVPIEFRVAENGRWAGAASNRIFADQLPTVGVFGAGGFPFVYQGPVVDLAGLNTVVMAHATSPRHGRSGHDAFDAEVFFALRPGVVCPVYRRVDDVEQALRAFMNDRGRNLALKWTPETTRFREHYVPAAVVSATGGAWVPDPFFFDPPALKRTKLPKRIRSGSGVLLGYFSRAMVDRLIEEGHRVIVSPWPPVQPKAPPAPGEDRS